MLKLFFLWIILQLKIFINLKIQKHLLYLRIFRKITLL